MKTKNMKTNFCDVSIKRGKWNRYRRIQGTFVELVHLYFVREVENSEVVHTYLGRVQSSRSEIKFVERTGPGGGERLAPLCILEKVKRKNAP